MRINWPLNAYSSEFSHAYMEAFLEQFFDEWESRR